MKKITLFFALISMSLGFSQTFTDSGGPYDLQNGNGGTNATCGTADALTLPLTVSGVGTLGATNILQSFTFNATHTWNADIRVELQDPSGATTVLLIEDIGGSGDGFVNCFLEDTGNALPTTATTPVTGTFEPLNPLSGFNGLDADGDWNLLVCDDANGDVGTIDSWSLTFAPPPSCPVPTNVAVTTLDITADVSWNTVTEAVSGYEWVVMDTGVAPDVATAVDTGLTATGVTTDTASNLIVSTDYDFYVRANCDSDGYSDWSNTLIFTTLAGPPPTNDLCENATPLVCGTPLTGQTTALATGGSATSCVGTIGDDVWYQLTGSDVDVVLTVTASVEEAQVEIYESTDGSCSGITLNTCFASGGSGENPVEVLFSAFSGSEYFIRVGNWINGDPAVEFEISAVCTPLAPAPECAMEPITPTDGEVDLPAFSPVMLSWTAPASGPAPTSYDIFVGTMSDGSDQAFFANTVDTFYEAQVGAYDTTIYWSVVPLNETSPATGCMDTLWSFTSESAPPPPANDDCSGAIALTVGNVFTDNPVAATNESATASEIADSSIPAPGCASYLGGDVWFSVVVPSDGIVDIELNANPTGSGGDGGAAVYSGSCGSLTLIECDDDASDDGLYPLISIDDSGLAGQTLYIRAWEYGNNATIAFQVSAYNATLSTTDFERQDLFVYYPNPVNDNLTLKGKQAIQNVAVYNMLGQEVLRTSPNTVNSDVDMSTLQSGAYFVKVEINNTTETIRVIKK